MKPSDFTAKIILYSKCFSGPDLITFQLRYPRMVHADFMTHRVFSRNARSSRAVPTKKLLLEEIYVPHFLKNQPGMQAVEEFSPEILAEIQADWIDFAEHTQNFAERLLSKGVHKQWANRPLEWFGYIDTLVTATDWGNFFELREHEAAQPEIFYLAQAMKKSLREAEENGNLQYLAPGEWHLPYVTGFMSPEEISEFKTKDFLRLSTARCARVSYEPFDGNGSFEKEFARHDHLVVSRPPHMSPAEHQAQVYKPSNQVYLASNLEYPWVQYRKFLEKKILI